MKNTLGDGATHARHSKSQTDFVEAFSGRIQSLARAHTLLTQNTSHEAELGAIIHDQLVLDETDEARISCSGPALTLEPQLAMQFALLIHELGTNARKHGALSAQTRRIDISWSVSSEGGRELQFKWIERKGPQPRLTAQSREGFGTCLLRQVTSDGCARMSTHTGGITWEIQIPLPEVRENAPSDLHVPHQERLAPQLATISALTGKRVLVVEDEAMIALELASILEAAGVHVIGPASTVEQARKLLAERDLDAGLLDVNVGGVRIDDFALHLVRRKIPLAFLTGYGKETLPAALTDAELVPKPFQPDDLLAALGRLMRKDGRRIVPLQAFNAPYPTSDDDARRCRGVS